MAEETSRRYGRSDDELSERQNEQMVQVRKEELEVKKAKLEMREEEQKVQYHFFMQQ